LIGEVFTEVLDRWSNRPIDVAVAVCDYCGSGVTLPAVSDRELADFYPDTYDSYTGERATLLAQIADRFWLRPRYSRICQNPPFAVNSSLRVLDIGCGSGNLLDAYKSEGNEVYGVDPSPDSIRSLGQRNIPGFCGYPQEFVQEFKDQAQAQFDLIVFHHSLEHLAKISDFSEIVGTCLSDNGKVIVAVPFFDSVQRNWFGRFWLPLDLPRHRFHFSQRGLEEVLASADLEIETVDLSTSNLGFFGSLQFRIFHRCLAPGGIRLYLAHLLLVLSTPLTWLLSRLFNHTEDNIIVSARHRPSAQQR